MRDALPEPVESIIGKLLQKRPEDRFQSALEVTRSLDALEALYRDAAAASRRGAPTMPAFARSGTERAD